MSNYDPQSWQVPTRETAWDQGPLSGGNNQGSPMQAQQQQQQQQQQYDQTAFHRQQEVTNDICPFISSTCSASTEAAYGDAEIDRAYDNMRKNGKLYPRPFRRDSIPVMGATPSFSEYAPRMSQRRSVDYDQMRPHSNSNVQGYYANQRQQPRPSETEQMMQAKRRMAAQRERELRNYHQQQQYNRNVNVQGRSDGSSSPNTLNNDEDLRELLARQHAALYRNEASYYEQDANTPRASQPTSGQNSSSGNRGPSPGEYASFNAGQGPPSNNDGHSQLGPGEQNQQGQKRPSPSHENSTASPASNQTNQNYGIFESTAQQSSRTSTSSPGGSPPRQGKNGHSGVAPIGTRPAQAGNPVFAKGRSGTPSQSPLSHGFSVNNGNLNLRGGSNDRAPSSASNPTSGAPKEQPTSAWGTSSGVWGSGGNNKSVGAVWG